MEDREPFGDIRDAMKIHYDLHEGPFAYCTRPECVRARLDGYREHTYENPWKKS